MPIKSERLTHPSLESVRGIAALMVAIGHSLITIQLSGNYKIWLNNVFNLSYFPDIVIAKLVLIVANGEAAVDVFFILSGVVLGMSLDRDDGALKNKYATFILRRIFRIFPAHIFVIISISIVLGTFSIVNTNGFPLSSDWYNKFFTTPKTSIEIVKNLLLFEYSINPLTWTLQVEIFASFLLPLFHSFSRKKSHPINLSAIFILFFLSIFFKDTVFSHLYKFYIGILIPALIIDRNNLIDKLKRNYAAFSIMAFFLLLIAPKLSLQIFPKKDIPSIFIHDFSQTTGATIIILMAMVKEFKFLTENRSVKKLGLYSYSFYLWHFPVLWLSYYFLSSHSGFISFIKTSPLLAMALVCLATIYLAHALSSISYRLVELPMMNIGRKISFRN